VAYLKTLLQNSSRSDCGNPQSAPVSTAVGLAQIRAKHPQNATKTLKHMYSELHFLPDFMASHPRHQFSCTGFCNLNVVRMSVSSYVLNLECLKPIFTKLHTYVSRRYHTVRLYATILPLPDNGSISTFSRHSARNDIRNLWTRVSVGLRLLLSKVAGWKLGSNVTAAEDKLRNTFSLRSVSCRRKIDYFSPRNFLNLMRIRRCVVVNEGQWPRTVCFTW
jgi:hypothetical protein